MPKRKKSIWKNPFVIGASMGAGAISVVLAIGLILNMAGLGITGAVVTDDVITPDAPGAYVPFTLTNVYMNVMNALDTDASYGADDVKVRVWGKGDFDFTGAYLDEDANAATSGQVDLAAKRISTNSEYDYLAYQGDGGTNIYAVKGEVTIPALLSEIAFWTNPEVIYVYTEGAFTESALDSATANFDETSDVVNLNKTSDTVQGCLEWDFQYSNSVSGSILSEPIIMFEESSATPMTDPDDIEELYLSVKSGSGVTFPSKNLVTEFKAAIPIHTTDDGMLGSADGVVGTLKVCLPAAEADVGTGNFLMHFDDLGDYRARDLDNDVRAAAETTTFEIEE